MKTKLIVVSKIKSAPFADESLEYLRRIKKIIPFELVEVADSEAAIRALRPGTYCVALDESGVQYTSRQFSEKISKLLQSSHKEIVWIVGGSYGLGPALKERANELFSLSKLTMSHDLARVVFLEQFYRGLSILKGLPYHHD
ncbi:MAG: 23S rRNA (pseudouridine(1915)-N(3))-methyltransferase RlmH [Deltaproteobacteria bacterium]|nr:23S rRNA (pseudouridine(1915)-N(3))-methyltransferase RlmH [Deltaproteobacteria bacterium]